MRKIKFILPFALSSLLFLGACGGGENKQEESSAEEFEYTEAEQEESSEQVEQTQYFLPSALQIGSVFQKSGLKYYEGIVNSPLNVEKYDTKNSMLLNFGGYSADLAYCVLNGQNQIALNQMQALRGLAEGIGMSSIFNSESLFNKFENNLGNQDSVIEVMVQIQENIDMFIDDNNMQSMANIMFAGAWIEGMYIGVKATSNEEETQITGRLIEQMVILDNLVKAISSVENKSGNLEEIEKSLISLRDYFNNLEEIKGKQNINYKEVEIGIDKLKEIANRVVKMRNSIVEPS
jgi:hypothetical protein